MFSADSSTQQSAERLIFAVDPEQITLYEQIHYTGSPTDFAWVLPVPSVPRVGTASMSLFKTLDQQTAPAFFLDQGPSCPGLSTSPAPSNGGLVNMYSSGAVGPYSYDVIGSSDPQALTRWLSGHNYHIPAASQAEIQPYIAAHMLFVAMRLHNTTNTQDRLPVKITYPTRSQTVTLPLRMATPMGKDRLGVLVWIFAQGRYVAQNYQALHIQDSQLSDGYRVNYEALVEQEVSRAHGHGFVTEYAQPTSTLYASDPDVSMLQKSYPYLTRLYTSMAPEQITLDPSFVAAPGLPDINSGHEVANPDASQGLSCPLSPLVVGAIIVGTGVLIIVLARLLSVTIRRKNIRARKP